MYSFLNVLNQTATNVMDGGGGSSGAQGAARAMATHGAASSDSIAYTFLAIAVLAVALMWYLMTRTPYPPRRYRRTSGKGPAGHLTDALINRISGFLP